MEFRHIYLLKTVIQTNVVCETIRTSNFCFFTFQKSELSVVFNIKIGEIGKNLHGNQIIQTAFAAQTSYFHFVYLVLRNLANKLQLICIFSQLSLHFLMPRAHCELSSPLEDPAYFSTGFGTENTTFWVLGDIKIHEKISLNQVVLINF